MKTYAYKLVVLDKNISSCEDALNALGAMGYALVGVSGQTAVLMQTTELLTDIVPPVTYTYTINSEPIQTIRGGDVWRDNDPDNWSENSLNEDEGLDV